jgi:uncharacterized protein (TIGR02145 family)
MTAGKKQSVKSVLNPCNLWFKIRFNPRHPRSKNNSTTQQKITIMKKLYFYVLLLSLWASGGLSAQVSVELIGKISIVPPQVAFTVSWTKAPYNNKIWVLAQYAKVSASGMGAEARAIITEVSATGATASTVTGNRGFWLEADGNNGSATVTATLSLADGVENFNWCVYAFDYPPNAVLQSDGTYQLRGSPPFTVNGDKLADGVKNFGAGTCITSITDATDNPEGIVLAVAWYSGGETSQTITVGDAITPITFETTCTTCITSVTSSGLPYGVSGTWTSPNYTVSGIPLLTGTYNYTLTAEDGNACSNASVYGTIKVEALPGTNQNQGGCTFMQPAVVSTFALFPANYYSASTFVTLTDERDRNNYTVVKIGSKWVMAQNLNYQTGLTWQTDSNLPTQESGGAVNALIGHFWCPTIVGPLTSTRASCDVWGALYTWETTMMRDGKYAGSSGTDTAWPGDGAYCSGNGCTNNMNQGGRGICPPNWHVPTDAEWGDVFDAMETGTKDHNTGMTGTRGTNAGSRAKAACTCESSMSPCPTDAVAMWSYYASNTGTDNYGLRLLPAGHRGLGGGGFASFGDLLDLVSASAVTASLTMARRVSYNSAAVERRTVNRSGGQPARCISD